MRKAVGLAGGSTMFFQLAGVKFERYPGMEHDELGIWTSPGGDRVAWFNATRLHYGI